MKIFISGICGFVGSEMALGLRAAGYAVGGWTFAKALAKWHEVLAEE